MDTATLQAALDGIALAAACSADRGQLADYIPELAGVDPDQFGIAVCLPDGQVFCAGQADTGFSLQSISKVFTLAIALGRLGDSLWARVGREPSGTAFNSISQLELDHGRPRNPFVNAGALVVTDAILSGHQPSEVLAEILHFLRAATGDDAIHINKAVALSERMTAHRNLALAHFMRSAGTLMNPPDLVLGTYSHQCAVEMSCRQLARAGLFLAGHGPRLISQEKVRRINALMTTCGLYDGSGDFAYRIGLPGKSGVGGGVLAIAPGRASIAAWSPGLDRQGNSMIAVEALESLIRLTNWSIFG